MAITYVPGANPIWELINLVGELAGGAKLYTKSSLTFADKAVYMDPAGSTAYTNPIIFNANGTRGPFYFSFDDSNPADNYFLQAFDSDDNLLWTVNNYAPTSGSGGISPIITTVISLENYISNGALIDHVDSMAAPATTTNLVIAPSNHKGFTPADIAPVTGTFGVVGPDIRFVRNSTASLDQITFETFALADNPFTLLNGVTPVEYLRYRSTNTSGGEIYKAFQFPICQKVKNLTNQSMTFQLFAMATTNVTLTLYTRQYYGNGTGATAEVAGTTRQVVGTLPLTNVWTKFNVAVAVPNVGGNTLGTPNLQTDDDALYLQLEMPLNVNCDVSFILPVFHLGTVGVDKDFDSYDQIYSIAQSVRTGAAMLGFGAAPHGWVACDTSIGNVGSGATRANKDTFFLYKTIWDAVPSNTFAPVATGRGASAIADFLAGKALTLPRALGRALAAAGHGTGLTARVLGEWLGTETIAIADMPAHDHPGSTVAAGVGGGTTGFAEANATGPTHPVTVAIQGGSAANGKMQPTTFMNVFIKL